MPLAAAACLFLSVGLVLFQETASPVSIPQLALPGMLSAPPVPAASSMLAVLENARSTCSQAASQLEDMARRTAADRPLPLREELEENLRMLDQVIALAERPARGAEVGAWDCLLSAYQEKVDYLRSYLSSCSGEL